MREAALYYAATLGWHVFPVGPDGRTPLIKGGCHAASCGPSQVEAWWRRSPGANVALACGPASGVLALDIDRHGDVDGFAQLAALEREFGALPHTVEAETPSGGRHLLFAYPADVHPQNRVGIKRWRADGTRHVYVGLDVRGRGASICLTPSRKPTGAYTWRRAPWDQALTDVPEWLLGLMLSEPPPRPPPPIRSIATPERVARYVCAAVDGECGELAGMASGSGRNQRLFIAAARLGSLIGAGLLPQDDAEAALERAASECRLVAEDGVHAVRATIASGIRRGVQAPREVRA